MNSDERNKLNYVYDILSTFCSYYGNCCCDCPVNDLDEETISDQGCPIKILEEITKE